jgi:hypothetical protein
MRAFLLGIFVALAGVAIVVFGIIQTGAVPARQDIRPGNVERWMAHTSLKATIEREAPRPPYPFGPPDERGYVAAANLYVQNCAVCHGTAHSTPTAIARGFAVRPPQLPRTTSKTIRKARRTGRSRTASATPECPRSASRSTRRRSGRSPIS